MLYEVITGAYVGCMIETSLGTAAYLAVAVTAPPVTWGCELFGPLGAAGLEEAVAAPQPSVAVVVLRRPAVDVERPTRGRNNFV